MLGPLSSLISGMLTSSSLAIHTRKRVGGSGDQNHEHEVEEQLEEADGAVLDYLTVRAWGQPESPAEPLDHGGRIDFAHQLSFPKVTPVGCFDSSRMMTLPVR